MNILYNRGFKRLFKGKRRNKTQFEQPTAVDSFPEPSHVAKVDEEVRDETSVTIIPNDPAAEETVVIHDAVEEEEEEVEEEEEEQEGDKLQYKRINTMHAELYVPLSAKSGDVLDIEHDGAKQIKVPSGQQGQSITIRMIKQEKNESSTGAFCGCI